MERINLALDVGCFEVKYLWVQEIVGYFLTSSGNVSFSRTLLHGVT